MTPSFTPNPKAKSLAQFFKKNPGFVLDAFNLLEIAGLDSLNWKGLNREEILTELKIWQRLNRITRDEQSSSQLKEAGYHSAAQIAMVPEGEFVDLMEGKLGDALKIHRKSSRIRSQAFRLALGTPVMELDASGATAAAAQLAELPDFQEGLPNYVRLFGPQLWCDCPQCQSIYSPAAYFVDLMRLIDEYITQPSAGKIPAGFALDFRRPDLWAMDLDCAETNDEYPYLQIVNEVLTANLSTNYLEGESPLEYLYTAQYPMVAPINFPLEQLRAAMKASKTSLAAWYSLLDLPAAVIGQEELGLSAEMWNFITNSSTATTAQLAGQYGFHDTSISDTELTNSLSSQSVFLEKTGLSASELEDLVIQDFRAKPVTVLEGNGSGYLQSAGKTISEYAGTITIEMWLRPHNFTNRQNPLCKSYSGEFALTLENGDNAGMIHFYYGGKSGCNSAGSSEYASFLNNKAIPQNAWSHIAFVRDIANNQLTSYVDGVQTNQIAMPTGISVSGTTCNLYLGNGYEEAFDGGIAEVRIWKSARTRSQIVGNLFNRLDPRQESDLVSYWPLSGGAGTTEKDLGPAGMDLTMGGNPLPVWKHDPDLPLDENEAVSPLMHRLFLNNALGTYGAFSGDYLALKKGETPQLSQLKISSAGNFDPLTDPILDKTQRLIRLAAVLGWKFADLDWAMRVAGGFAGTNFTPQILEGVAGIKNICTRLQIPVDEATALLADIKTYGRGSSGFPQDLWDRTFHSPPVPVSSKAKSLFYRPEYSMNPLFVDQTIAWDSATTAEGQDAAVRTWLQGALGLSSADLTSLASWLSQNQSQLSSTPAVSDTGSLVFGLDVTNLSLFYRIATLARLLKLSLPDFLTLVDLSDTHLGIPSSRGIMNLVDLGQWIQRSGLSVPKVAWLVTGKMESAPAQLPDARDLNKALATLDGAAAPLRLHQDSFIKAEISKKDSEAIYNQLVTDGFISRDGLVLKETPLTYDHIYTSLGTGPETRAALFKMDPFRKVLNLNGNSVSLAWDPFSDAQIQSTNSYTLSFWVNGQGLIPTGWPRFVGNSEGSNQTKSPSVSQVPGQKGYIQLGSGSGQVWNSFDIADFFTYEGEWVHLAWVCDHGNWYAYRNGLPAGPNPIYKNVPTPYLEQSTPTYLFGSFEGALAEVQLWNVALSQAEIQANLYTTPSSKAPGLIGYWPMNEASGQTVKDKQKNGTAHDGTIAETAIRAQIQDIPAQLKVGFVTEILQEASLRQEQFVASQLAGAFGISSPLMAANLALTSQEIPHYAFPQFNGVNNYIDVPWSADLNTPEFTIYFKAKATGLPEIWRYFISSYGYTTGVQGYNLAINDKNCPQLGVFSENAKAWRATGPDQFPLNEWVEVTGSLKGTEMSLYINGELAAQENIDTYGMNATGAFRIGAYSQARNPTPGYYFKGQIQKVAYWNAAVSRQTIAGDLDKMAAGQTNFSTNLVGYWALDNWQKGNTSVPDLTGHGHNGTLHGTLIQAGYPASQLLSLQEQNNPNRLLYLQKLVQNVALSSWLKLSPADVTALANNPGLFGIESLNFETNNLTLSQVVTLWDYKRLCSALGDRKGALLAYFQAPLSEQPGLLARITGWDLSEINALEDQSTYTSVNFATVKGLQILYSAFSLTQKTGMSMQFMLGLQNLTTLPDPTTSSTTAASNYSTFQQAANSVTNALEAREGSSVSSDTVSALKENSLSLIRDLLSNLLIWFLKQDYRGIDNLQDLYEYLLVDVEMDSSQQISYLKQGLDSLQLYVNRCFSNLEPKVVNNIPKSWWEWMNSYRVWQVNREVYLYPENYVDPTLRKLQSQLFKDLVSQISQGEVTDKNVDKAVYSYLEGLAGIANLRVVDAYAQNVQRSIPGVSDQVHEKLVFLFGASRNDPPTFYWRTAVFNTDERKSGDLFAQSEAGFTPWQKIPVQINAEFLTPVFAFNKLFVFWTEHSQKNITNGSGEKLTVTYADIYYAYQTAGAGWTSPQTLISKLIIDVEGSTDLTTAIQALSEYLNGYTYGDSVQTRIWQKPIVFLLPASEGEPEKILITLGDWIYDQMNEPITRSSTPFTTHEEAEFYDLIYKGATKSFQVFSEEVNQSTSLMPAFTLTAGMVREEVLLNFDNTNAYIFTGVVMNQPSDTSLAIMRNNNPIYLEDFPHSIDDPFNDVVAWWMVNEGTGVHVESETGNYPGTSSTSDPDWQVDSNFPLGTSRPYLSFNSDGTDGKYVSIGNHTIFNKNSNFAIEAWVKSEGNSLGIFASGDMSGSSGIYFGLNMNSGSMAFKFTLRSIADYFSSAITLNEGEWYHAAVSVDGNRNLSFYLNGVQVGSTVQISSSLSAPSTPASFPAVPVGYYGGVANLIFFGAYRSAVEVQNDYQTLFSPILYNLSPKNSFSINVKNQPDWLLVNAGKDAFMLASDQQTPTQVEKIVVDYDSVPGQLKVSFSDPLTIGQVPTFKAIRLTTSTVSALQEQFMEGGTRQLLQLSNQYTPEIPFSTYDPAPGVIVPPNSDWLDFDGPYGQYFWELFFHLPWFIANRLGSQQQFTQAKNWYQYVFDPTRQAEPGLIAYWPLANGGLDVVHGHNGTPQTGIEFVLRPFVDGLDKKVMFWNQPTGHSSSIQVDYSPDLCPASGLSMLAWVYMTAIPDDFAMVLKLNNGTGDPWPGEYSYLFGLNGSAKPELILNLDSTGQVLSGPSPVPLNTWVHLAATWDGGEMKLYVNGYQVASMPVAGQITPPQPGQNVYLAGDTFPGYMSEVRFYRRGISQKEVARDMYNFRRVYTNRFWQVAPFRGLHFDSLFDQLSGRDTTQVLLYEYDPFDPDAIASQRISAWQKGIFMNYITNLINYGDYLFTEDSWETITEATMYYVLADDLLGKLVTAEAAASAQPVLNYAQIENLYATNNQEVPVFLIEAENSNLIPFQVPGSAQPSLPDQILGIVNAYFCIPPNTGLLQLKARVQEQLYKIRHGLNIDGQTNDIPLFEPPINPNSLVQASAGGGAGTAATASTPPAIPYYRFTYMINQAKGLAQEVVRMGNELLAALEKQDGEQLQMMQSTYTNAIWNMTVQVKTDMINQLNAQTAGLNASLDLATTQQSTYETWISNGLNSHESDSLILQETSLALQSLASLITVGASIAYLVPNIFGLADGGMNWGGSAQAVGKASEVSAGVLGAAAGLTGVMGGFDRRTDEWNLQLEVAESQVSQIQAQIQANQFAIAAATQDLNITQTQVQQTQDVINFLQTKFTNQELYQWMAGQLSNLYYQGYQLAWTVAQMAQSAYQYELNSTQNFLNSAAWNNQYKGLLAGDALALGLNQMEQAYVQRNNPKLEISKTISLLQVNPQALLNLISQGTCTFDLTELLYDYDFPGHYNRKIKTLSVSIPAVVGPYQNVHATLTQLSNVVVTKASIGAVEYLMGLRASAPTDGSLRSNWYPNQAIALSTGNEDGGMFTLDFGNPQYLPFEGTGAVSSWQLDMPQSSNGFDLRTITDVIIKVSYTAEDGGATFRNSVTAETPMKTFQGYRLLSLRQLYAGGWYEFLRPPYQLNFKLSSLMFPFNLRQNPIQLGNSAGDVSISVVLGPDLGNSDIPAMTFTTSENGGADHSGWSSPTQAFPVATNGSQETLPAQPNQVLQWSVQLQNPGSSLLLSGSQDLDPAKLVDVLVVVPFTGTLNW
ncbi:MAG: hypothetical protein H6581_02955 [Bacteroidia bacterium]|nr:hypothetical protein [Bacteroidia bacterium]